MRKVKIESNVCEKANSGLYLLKKYAKGLEFCENAETSIVFSEDGNLSGDDYRIEKNPDSIFVFGNSAVAFNAAVGKLIRGGIDDAVSTSRHFDQEVRAIYFANHFHNYYHCAPMNEILEYIESLALWGQSCVWLWFDMHHFYGIETLEAEEMIGRMKKIFAKARSLGMKTALTKLANEYYEGAPQEVLAENSTQSGLYSSRMCGFFNTEICPSNQEGKKLIIKALEDLLNAFSDVGVDYITLWPYDQGGCSCEKCYPWGGKGFYDLSKELAAIIKNKYPDTKVGISTWFFDRFIANKCEYESFFGHFKNEDVWFDYVISNENHSSLELVKSQVPVISFPEISMAVTPWGGYGAAPVPMKIASELDYFATYCNGCMVYSEGIFEDVNKIICLEKCRDKNCDVKEIVREYCSSLVGAEFADELTDLVFELEKTLPRAVVNSKGENMEYPSGQPKELHTFLIENKDLVKEVYGRFVALNEKLPECAKKDWRYEILYLRAIGDYELCMGGGIPNDATDKIYTRLVEIFHAEKAGYFVSPITRESIMSNREHI